LRGNGSANTLVPREQLCKHAAIPDASLSNVPMQLSEAVFSVLSVPRLYNEGQLLVEREGKSL
jgi:hypothetical protein